MRFHVVALDFDGTLAQEGRVADSVQQALMAVRSSGRKLILITGRELESLRSTFAAVGIFDLVVAENGALLYHPATQQQRPLCGPPSGALVTRLHHDGVHPLSTGRCILATVRPYELTVQTAIRELGLDLQIILNREAVMVLPAGVDKGTGLAAALNALRLPASEALGIGDAENDYAFLRRCGLSVAVGNAIPRLKQQVHLVTARENGAGVIEAVKLLLADDRAYDSVYLDVSDLEKSLHHYTGP